MTTTVAKVHADDSLWSVLQRFRLGALRHVVVVDRDDRFVSVLSDRLASEHVGHDQRELELIRVHDLVLDETGCVPDETTLVDAGRHMLRRSAGALAVVDADRRVLGVLTGADVLRALLDDQR